MIHGAWRHPTGSRAEPKPHQQKVIMRRAIAALAVLAATSLCPVAAQAGQPLPEIRAVKWYNTPPLTNEDLHGKAVLIEVFRTW